MEKNLEIFFWVKFELKEDNQFETKISPILIKFDILSTIINQNRFFDKKKKKKNQDTSFYRILSLLSKLGVSSLGS